MKLSTVRLPKRPWLPPTFTEIRMSAEIGSYQNEFDERKAPPPPRNLRDA